IKPLHCFTVLTCVVPYKNNVSKLRPNVKIISLRVQTGKSTSGWDEGVAQRSLGEVACSPDYAYGSKGHTAIIPTDFPPIFEVELLNFHGLESDVPSSTRLQVSQRRVVLENSAVTYRRKVDFIA
uniref:peptidylprolyl isomerase n=1 Tax=Stegastes partitus TaxID=144197 RepID=A0A3B5AA43_9TELE